MSTTFIHDALVGVKWNARADAGPAQERVEERERLIGQ
jgi:hypothetical protein